MILPNPFCSFALGLCTAMPAEKMLPFGAQVVSHLCCSHLVILIKIVEKEINEIAQRISPFAYMTMEVNLQAGCGCRGLGARSGLPKCTDPRLADY